MPEEFVLGMNCKLYRNTNTYASPTWVILGNVKDVNFSLEKGEADVTTRANNGWRATAGTLKDGSIEFEMIWAPGDAGFTAIQTAFLNNTSIEFLVLDGPVATEGSQGLRALMQVMTFSRNESLEEAVTVSVSLKPTYSSNPPAWFTAPAP
jgi:hypothetical protein